MINRKRELPRIYGHKGKVISTQNFLAKKYKIKTYYGPGQRPDAGELGYYVTPTKWPDKWLLRPPQVVWLYVGLSFQYNTKVATYLYYTHSSSDIPIASYGTGLGGGSTSTGNWGYAGHKMISGRYYHGAIWALDGGSPVAPPPNSNGAWALETSIATDPLHPQWYQVTPPGSDRNLTVNTTFMANRNPAERVRLLSIFNAVKSKIEKLRPNRTYIEILDPWTYDPTTDTEYFLGKYEPHAGYRDKYFTNHYTPSDYGIAAPTITVVPNNQNWAMMSPITGGNYFGTDFLNIHCGSCQDVEYGTPALQRSVNSILVSLGLLRDVHKRFSNYAVKLFYSDVLLDTLPLYNPTWSYPGTFTLIDETDYKIFAKDEWDAADPKPLGSPWSNTAEETINESIADENELITNYNNFTAIAGPSRQNFLHVNVETALKSIGIDCQRMGGTSQITEDYLTNLIASHYKFHPSTGKDL